MNSLHALTTFLTVFLILVAPSISRAQSPELLVLQLQYDNAVLDRVTKVYNAALGSLDVNYSSGLDRSLSDATAAGDLESALSLQAEKKRIASKEALPADDEQASKILRRLRGIYRGELAKLDVQRATNQTAVLAPHLEKLKQLEIDLTKATRLSDAKAVMDYRQGLASGVPMNTAVVSSGSAPGVVKAPSAAIPFGARLVEDMKVYASGSNGCLLYINGKEVIKVMRDKASVASHSVKEGDIIAVQNNDRFDINSFWMSAIASSGEFLFETSKQWTGYIPTDAKEWWNIKEVKKQKRVEFAPDDQEYVSLVKHSASETPLYLGAQPIRSELNPGTLDGQRSPVYLYYVVTKADLVPKKDRK